MTFRKLLIILTFTVTVMVIMLLGTSYAWYQFDNAVTGFNNVQTFENDLDDLAIVFTNNNNISTTVGVPILAADVEKFSNKTTFTLTPKADKLEGKEVAFQISLVELNIDSALTNSNDLKWSLVEKIGNGGATTVASGNFRNVTEDTLVIKEMTEIDTFDVTYSYEFRLWLEESGANQNHLMNKNISGKIRVSSIAR